jgi:hypothetical protein
MAVGIDVGIIHIFIIIYHLISCTYVDFTTPARAPEALPQQSATIRKWDIHASHWSVSSIAGIRTLSLFFDHLGARTNGLLIALATNHAGSGATATRDS